MVGAGWLCGASAQGDRNSDGGNRGDFECCHARVCARPRLTNSMNTTPYWADTSRIKSFPALSRNVSVDVAVIGGGITGITTAYLLKKAGATVALIEREQMTALDTGHTTAHLTYVTDLRISGLVKNFGRDHARAVWEAGEAAIQQINSIIEEAGVDCEFSSIPGYLHAPVRGATSSEKERLLEDAKLAAELGFDAAFVEKAPLVERPAVRFSNQAKFHPDKYSAALLKEIAGGGCRIFEGTAVEEICDNPLSIKANGHVVKCGHVVIATHVPLQGLSSTLSAALFQTKLSPHTSYAIGAKIPKGIAPEVSFWDTNEPYDYLRIDRHKECDYAIFGGGDHKTGQAREPARRFRELEQRLKALISDAKVDHCWSGQVIGTNDGLPFMGETAPKQFVATGFSGNGMTFGTVAAMMARDFITGHKNPWQELFDVNRKMIRGAVWDYIRENKDYPYYFVKDRLAIPDAKSLRVVKRGGGKIVRMNGKKLAVFRNTTGKLSIKSAVCPHLGCIVQWNGAEKTWDCPCHGSRFKATGEVIAGPAESGLSEAS